MRKNPGKAYLLMNMSTLHGLYSSIVIMLANELVTTRIYLQYYIFYNTLFGASSYLPRKKQRAKLKS